MCNIWNFYRNKPEKLKKELSVEDYREIFTVHKEYLKNLIHVGITGGEPFLRDDLSKIIAIIHETCPKSAVDITTNGLLPDKVESEVKDMINTYPDLKLNLNISMDGLEKTHNKIRGLDSAYELLILTAKKLIEIKKDNEIDVKISFTILPQNHTEIYDVYKISQKLGFKFSCRPVHTSTAFYGNKEFLKNSFSSSMITTIEKQLKKIHGIDFFIEYIPNYLKGRGFIVPCYSGFYSIYLNPFGDVYPCLFIDKKMGNIKDTDFFKEVWFSKEFNDIRNMIKERKCPNCWTECEINHSLYLDGLKYICWTIKSLSEPF